MTGAPDPIYVRARRVLLDALEALREQAKAVVLVGAQAVYLHTGEADLAVAPFTVDADLVLDPARLADEPKLADAMGRAGFVPAPESARVGTWIGRHNVPVDLLVPEAVSGPGKRGARLGTHGDHVARKGRGLEAVLVDNEKMPIRALEPGDTRRFEVAVAGPSALLVAKLHKIAERQRNPRRLEDKDALDIYRLLTAVPTEVFEAGINKLLENPLAGAVTREALAHLGALFGTPDAPGAQMAVRATQGLEDADILAASSAALAGDLLAAARR